MSRRLRRLIAERDENAERPDLDARDDEEFPEIEPEEPSSREVVRTLCVLRHIAASRFATIPDMARRFGVTTRTVRRDLEALEEAGFPLTQGGGYWRLLILPGGKVERLAFAASTS